MRKNISAFLIFCYTLLFCTISSIAAANNTPPVLTPEPPSIAAKSYILMDYQSGQLLAHRNEHDRLEPASLTKIMTLYVVNKELSSGKLHMDDLVHISDKAWRAEGSRMFVEVNKDVSVSDLVHGLIIQSGNDASIALAEHIAGSEESFAELMNAYAKSLGMNDSHFTDATGWPHENHYTTAYDLALLARAMIHEFPPELYAIHSEKWFVYNNIKQPNRNRLLWRNPTVDGIKTGHTEGAGYCLVASAKKEDMRLISVVMGTDSDTARAEQSNKLITYGFRFYETHPLFTANTQISEAPVYMGQTKLLPVGLEQDLFVNIPQGQYASLVANMNINKHIAAPVAKGQVLGSVVVSLGDKLISEKPLVALAAVEKGGLWSRFSDYVSMHATQLFKSKN